MKQLTCEMCGSTDLVKQDGVFVCQTCGCKYSVEEAKKMMIEGTVDVSGSIIKVDNSAFVEKYLANARRSKEKEDWEETEKYYNLVEQNDPNNIEAIFYSAYGKARATLADRDYDKRAAAFAVLKKSISIIDDNYDIELREKNQVAIRAMADDLAKLFSCDFPSADVRYAGKIVPDYRRTYQLFDNVVDAFKESIENIEKKDDQPYLHEAVIGLYNAAIPSSMATFNMTAAVFGYGTKWDYNAIDNYISKRSEDLKKWSFEERQKLSLLNQLNQAALVAEKKRLREKYWNEHSEEREKLDAEKQQLTEEKALVEEAIKPYNERIKELLSRNKEKLPLEDEHHDLQNKVRDLESGFAKLGVFKSKERKRLQEQYSEEKDKLRALEQEIKKQKDERAREINEQIAAISKEMEPLNQRLKELKDRIDGIDKELTKDR